MNDHVFVYSLVDPRDGVVRYVGKSKNPAARLAAHKKGSRYNARVDEWISALSEAGLAPQMIVIEECSRAAGNQTEGRWIETHRATVLNHFPSIGCGRGGGRAGAGRLTKSVGPHAEKLTFRLYPNEIGQLDALTEPGETTTAVVRRLIANEWERRMQAAGEPKPKRRHAVVA